MVTIPFHFWPIKRVDKSNKQLMKTYLGSQLGVVSWQGREAPRGYTWHTVDFGVTQI